MSLLLTASMATAASSTAGTAKSVSAFGLMLQLLLGLAVVLGLIWVVARVLRGRVTGTKSVRRKQNPIDIVGRQSLGKGVQLAVVKAGTETYLIGVTQQQVTRLARYQPDLMEELDALETDNLDGNSEAPLRLPLFTRGAAGDGPPAGAIPARFQSALRQLQERTLRKS